jgi:hypothetical protein
VTTEIAPAPAQDRAARLRTAAVLGWRWFRAFRRTRPFWGGLWMLVGGGWILNLATVSWSVVIVTGITGLGGWVCGGGLILCGLTAWAAPSQRYVTGITGLILAVLSLIASNLGGLFLGMLFGIVGGAMTLAWGPKRPRRRGSRQYRLGRVGLVPAPPAEPAMTAPRPRPRPHPRPAVETASQE